MADINLFETEYEREKVKLGAELRRLRQMAGMSGQQLADSAKLTQAKVSRLETGRVAPTPETVRALLRVLSRKTKIRSDDRARLVQQAEDLQTEFSGWRFLLREGITQGQIDTEQLERQTRTVRVFQPAVIPGLLQTPDYARELFLRSPNTREDDVDAAVSARFARQRRLHVTNSDNAFVIAEWVLYSGFGGPDVMSKQLEWLISLSELPGVALSILPIGSSNLLFPPMHPFVIFDDDLVVVETLTAEMAIRSKRGISYYCEVFAAMQSSAVAGGRARQVIQRAAKSYPI